MLFNEYREGQWAAEVLKLSPLKREILIARIVHELNIVYCNPSLRKRRVKKPKDRSRWN